MGLPVWRESKHQESQAKIDPLVLDRSAIRRRREANTRPSAIWSGYTSNNRELDQNDTGNWRRNNTMSHPTLQRTQSTLRRREHDVPESSARPRSRRGPPTFPPLYPLPAEAVPGFRGTLRGSPGPDTASNPSELPESPVTLPRIVPSGDVDTEDLIYLPPLRRMDGRTISDAIPRSGRGRLATPPASNGLGDRRRSPTPDSPMADGWAIMGSTITPDPSLPSADNSFNSTREVGPEAPMPPPAPATETDTDTSRPSAYNGNLHLEPSWTTPDNCDLELDNLPLSPSSSASSGVNETLDTNDSASNLLADVRAFEARFQDFINMRGSYQNLMLGERRAVVNSITVFLRRLERRHERL